MIKVLKKRGNSYSLLIDKAIMQQLNINADTKLQLVVSNGSLIVTPEHVGLGKDGVDAVMDDLRAEYGDVWAELAK